MLLRAAIMLLASLALHGLFLLLVPDEPEKPQPPEKETIAFELIDPPESPPPAPPAPPAPPEPEPPAPPPERVVERPPPPPKPVNEPTPKEITEAAPLAENEGGEKSETEPLEPGTPPPGTLPPGSRPGGGGTSGGGSMEMGESGKVRLFDSDALGKSVSRWRSQQQSDDGMVGPGPDPGSPEAEHTRVSNRLGDQLAAIENEGRVRGGLVSSCNDGFDQGLDKYIDCADPGCRLLPVCQNTVTYANAELREIPDDNRLGISSEIVIPEGGTIRALSVRLDLRHRSPHDLAIVLENAETRQRVTLQRAERGKSGHVAAFYVREAIGQDAAGRWVLNVRDLVPGTSGSLRSWEMVLTR